MQLGENKQAILLVLFLLFAASSSGQTGNYKYRLNGNLNGTDITTGNQSLTIRYSAPELDVENITTENGVFYKVSIPGHASASVPGKPGLPVFSRVISIPEGSEYTVKIRNVEATSIKPSGKKIKGLLFPAQEGETKQSEQKKPEFRIDKNLYSARRTIMTDTVIIESLGKVRGQRLANLYINPVRYNPHTNVLEVITSMEIVIDFSMSGTKSSYLQSVPFNGSLAKGVLNFNPDEVITGYTDQPVKMVIITDTAFRKQLKPFITWKTQKGFKVNVIYRNSLTYTQLRDSLKNIYNSSSADDPPPDYLLIVGNTSRIPSYGTDNITDMYYGEFDGNGDYIPEMFIGRLPVADTSELKTVVRKIIQYEKFQFADTNTFHSNGLATAGYDAGYASYMNGQVKYAVSNYLTPANKIKEYHFYYPSSNTARDSVLKIINQGVSFINYSGHGDATGWLHLNIKVADTSRFTNRNMYPFIISNACRTAQFNIAGSFGNRMVLSSGKGAIGFIGCSNDSYWDEDFYWAVGLCTPSENPTYETTGAGALDKLFHTHGEPASNWFYTMGQVNFAGNLSVSSSTTIRKKYYWETYNLVGDPSVIPILGKPEVFDISLPDTLPNGSESWSFNAKPFSYIAISHSDTLLDATFASASGSVVLDFPAIKDDSCLLVITGQNNIPLIKTIHFSEINKEFVSLTSSGINDSESNNNNKADYGESMYLKINVNNLGLTHASDLRALISTTSDWVTLDADSVFIGTLASGSDTTLSDRLKFTVSDKVPDKGIVTLQLILRDSKTEKSYNIDIPVHAPVLNIINCTLDDSGSGNGDHIADPGETCRLIFRIMNEGSSDVSGQLYVTSPVSSIKIIDNEVKSGVIKLGETTEIPVTIKFSDIIPSGSYISVNSLLDCNPYILNKDFTFRIGKVRESFESQTFDIFPWINRSTKPWIITESGQYDGNISARSGNITHNGSSSLLIRTHYDTEDSLKFFFKVSSEKNYDYLVFKMNDIEVMRKSGETLWEKASFPVKAGYNKLEWIFSMDGSTLGGSNCAWIDLIDFAGSSAIRYVEKDLQVAKITTPVVRDRYGMAMITAKVLNTGKDTIDGFNLAYIIDNKNTTQQFFGKKLDPFSDTATVSFKVKADMTRLGVYQIVAYGYNNNDDYILNDTASVRVENTEISDSLVIFPNPFTDKLTIFINSRISDRLEISVTSISGTQMYNVKKDIVNGKNSIVLTDIRLAPAMYYLKIRGSTINTSVPVMKLR